MRRRTVWLVILVCAAPRLLALSVFGDPQRTLYLRLAENITDGLGYTLDGATATDLEPLYPAFLAVGREIAGQPGMLALQTATACIGGIALFVIAAARAGAQVAWTATLLYAGSPYLVRQAASFVEITLATTLAIVVVWSVDRACPRSRQGRDAGASRSLLASWLLSDLVLTGVVLGALLLTRFSFLPVAAGAAIVANRTRAVRAVVIAVATTAVVAPWMAFTRAEAGTLLPPRIGENLFVSTSAWAEPIVPWTNADVLLPLTEELVDRELGASSSIAERDRFLLTQALEFVAAHPFRTIALKAKNLVAVVGPRLLPFTERRGRAVLVNGVVRIPPQASRPLAFELTAGVFQALILAGGAVGAWKRRYHLVAEDAMLVVVALSVVAVNVVFFPTSRLLAPMTFVPMFYAAVAVCGFGRGAIAV
jgi:hypothetical protein